MADFEPREAESRDVEPRDHADRRGLIESVLRHVPGFRGYLEKEYRRESDRLQRDGLAGRLDRAKRALDALARPMADAGQIDLLPQVDRLRGRLDKQIGRIRGAMQGYSGFFDLVQIDEEALDRVYEHDAVLVGQVDALAETIEALPQEPAKLAAALADAMQRADELERAWDVRSDMLEGLADGGA